MDRRSIKNLIFLILMMGLFITVPIVAALIVPDGTETADENVAYITGKSDSVGEPADMSGYTFLDDKDTGYFLNTSFENVVQMFTQKKSGFVYVGFEGCEWCQRAVPVLDRLAKEKNTAISYLNLDTQDLESNEYQQFKALISSVLPEGKNGEKRLLSPLVLAIKNGEIVGSHISLIDGFKINSETDNLNEDQFNELLKIYEKMFEKI